MMNLKKTALLTMVSAMALGALPTKVSAHDGGAIILLPIILGKEIFNYNALNVKLMRHGFKYTVVQVSGKKDDVHAALVNKKSNTVYQFMNAKTLSEAKENCKKLKTGRLATPEEILKLAPLRELLPEVSQLITDPNDSQKLIGYYDSAQDRFSIDIKTKRIETSNKDADNLAQTAVCVQKANETEAHIFTNAAKELIEDSIEIIKNGGEEQPEKK